MKRKAIELLQRLIATPSVSRNESATASVLEQFLRSEGATNVELLGNNVWAVADGFDPSRPTLLLNSHHDTVPPSPSYTRDPYTPVIEDGRLYGLGSNDAGASVVTLACTFLALRREALPYNLALTLVAEEECSGSNGTGALLEHMAKRGIHPDAAIVGEPTCMQPMVGERGLVVLDCTAHGKAGHAARGEGINALYIALDDIDTLRRYSFDRRSSLLGNISLNVTQIQCGTRHNVIPDECRFVVDIRTTDAYSNEEVVEMISHILKSDVKSRSTRIRASAIDAAHPLVKAAVEANPSAMPMVSPTTSDMALMPFPSLKIGPGNSARSHSADEYVMISEIEEALRLYPEILRRIPTLPRFHSLNH